MSDADRTILEHIHALVEQEKALRAAHGDGALSDDDRARLTRLEGELDQAWDLLRRRRARAEYHENPDEASERPVDEVTRYLQ